MIVVVDANVIVSDPDLRSGVWEQLRAAVAAGRVRVLAPEIAIEEAVAKRQNNLRAIGKQVVASAGLAPAEAKTLAKQAQSECARVAEGYDRILRASWSESGFEIATTPAVPHADIARRAIQRIRPFNDQGNGYRDTLHWLVLLDLARQFPHDDFTLVTNDGIFSTRENKLAPSLMDEFESQSRAAVTLRRRLSELEVPGHFISEEVDAHEYEASLKERLLDLLREDYSLRRIRTIGIHVPSSDWDELVRVSDLAFTTITARSVERQANPEVRFVATANFKVRGSYIIDDDPEALELTTHDIEMKVEIVGTATTLNHDVVGSLRDVEAVIIGPDLYYLEEQRIAERDRLTH